MPTESRDTVDHHTAADLGSAMSTLSASWERNHKTSGQPLAENLRSAGKPGASVIGRVEAGQG